MSRTLSIWINGPAPLHKVQEAATAFVASQSIDAVGNRILLTLSALDDDEQWDHGEVDYIAGELTRLELDWQWCRLVSTETEAMKYRGSMDGPLLHPAGEGVLLAAWAGMVLILGFIVLGMVFCC